MNTTTAAQKIKCPHLVFHHSKRTEPQTKSYAIYFTELPICINQMQTASDSNGITATC